MPRRARQALIGAAACASLLVVVWLLAFHVGVFARADEEILSGFTGLNRPHVQPVAQWIAGLCSPDPYLFLAAMPILVALARRRVRVAAAVGAALVGANLTTQLLKPLLAHPHPASLSTGVLPVAPGSWPSGHATAAMTLALTSVIAAPTRWRPYVAAAGALFAVAVSYSFLTLEWHYPSDVFGGYLVAATWTLLAVAALLASDARQPRTSEGGGRPLSAREVLVPPALAVGGALLLVLLVALIRPHSVVVYVQQHTAFAVGALAIGALGVALATGLVLMLRRESPIAAQR